MNEPIFEWDPDKAAANQKKHAISFEEAKTAFYDVNARIIDDPDHSGDEDRFILLGVSSRLRVLAVCHCYRLSDSVIWIISARPATRNERGQYEEFLP